MPTKKLPKIREGDQTNPSVHLLIPDSSSSNTKTDPDVIILRSESTSRRVTRGMRPRRAASRMSRASPVVSIHPLHGGSGHPPASFPEFGEPGDSAGLDIAAAKNVLHNQSPNGGQRWSGHDCRRNKKMSIRFLVHGTREIHQILNLNFLVGRTKSNSPLRVYSTKNTTRSPQTSFIFNGLSRVLLFTSTPLSIVACASCSYKIGTY